MDTVAASFRVDVVKVGLLSTWCLVTGLEPLLLRAQSEFTFIGSFLMKYSLMLKLVGA